MEPPQALPNDHPGSSSDLPILGRHGNDRVSRRNDRSAGKRNGSWACKFSTFRSLREPLACASPWA